tara:strand:- start:81 stop:872 length:792 start_codon:yes stop_codon:yes gene_type:complete
MAANDNKTTPFASVKQVTIRRLHRRVGYAISLFLLFLVVTGVLMHRSTDWGIEEVRLGSSWLTSWYRPAPTDGVQHYQIGPHWLSKVDNRLYLNGTTIDGDAGVSDHVLGAVMVDDFFVVATADSLVLMSPDGQLIERIGLALLPGRMTAIGQNGNRAVIINTAYGQFVADASLMSWTAIAQPAGQEILWSRPQGAPEKITADVMDAYYEQGVLLTQFFYDVHTGRIFGTLGVWVMDVTALGVLFLLVSGLFRMRPQVKKKAG